MSGAKGAHMKILLLNPNTSQSVTDRIASAANGDQQRGC